MKPKRSRFSPTSLVLVPLKQHLGCCVVIPALIKIIGSIGLFGGLIVSFQKYHLMVGLLLVPVIVWLCLKLEDAIHSWQHRRGHFASGHKHDHHDGCSSCTPCPVDHTHHGFWRRYVFNLVIAWVLVLIVDWFHHHPPV